MNEINHHQNEINTHTIKQIVYYYRKKKFKVYTSVPFFGSTLDIVIYKPKYDLLGLVAIRELMARDALVQLIKYSDTFDELWCALGTLGRMKRIKHAIDMKIGVLYVPKSKSKVEVLLEHPTNKFTLKRSEFKRNMLMDIIGGMKEGEITITDKRNQITEPRKEVMSAISYYLKNINPDIKEFYDIIIN